MAAVICCLTWDLAHAAEPPEPDACTDADRIDPYWVLESMRNGWRPLSELERGEFGMINEVENARIIYDAFREGGYSNAIAFAAIGNAWAESALDNTAVMDDPFRYNGKTYPHGSGAIGLFQLLPSSSGAGGPTRLERGYPRGFHNEKYAGNAYQARHHGTVPDGYGRMYYDATDPRTNADRIVLEMERDGAAILEAEARGASIAHLTYLFGRDIERPGMPTYYRRQIAADMLGHKLAYARHPERLFQPDPVVDPVEEALALHRIESPWEPPESEVPPAPPREPRPLLARPPVVLGFLGLIGVFLFGRVRQTNKVAYNE